MTTRRRLVWTIGLLLPCALGPLAGRAGANVQVGDAVANAELPTLDGGRQAFMSSQARANVFVFFRPKQDHSLETLRTVARCQEQFSGKPVHWVAVVSSSWSVDEVRTALEESGTRMPVLVDEGDALYGRLGVRLHPAIGVADQQFRLVAYEPFHRINQGDRLAARIRRALGEIELADVARIDSPPPALFPNQLKGAVANRHVRMGEAHLKAKRYELAAAEAHRGLESDPLHARAHLLLGDALASQGRCRAAIASYDAARTLDSSLAGPAARPVACLSRE